MNKMGFKVSVTTYKGITMKVGNRKDNQGSQRLSCLVK